MPFIISGGAMVASLLTGGTSPSPIRPPNSGLPNTTTTFEVSEVETIVVIILRNYKHFKISEGYKM